MNILSKIHAKQIAIVASFLAAISFSSCSYLDVVPDNVATIDHAFNLKNQAEKYLFTCYSYMPKNGSPTFNVAMFGGDEAWMYYRTGFYCYGFEIARGNQRTSDTYYNAWDGYWDGAGSNDSYQLFDGIRHCNIFIENVSDSNQLLDLTDEERTRWIGEAEFLKAYYHFCLLRMYGPIPIVDKNVSIDASEKEVSVERVPVDSCFNYIATLLDSSVNKLPTRIADETNELGRIDQTIALALKAKVLLYAASPLFNGNTDYNSFADKNGNSFFSQTADNEKWVKAAAAANAAIDAATANGKKLYEFTDRTYSLTDTTYRQLSIRQAVCERWNSEIVWGNPNSETTTLQQLCMVPLSTAYNHNDARETMSAPLKVAEMFYTKNGVPIDEDKTLDFNNIAELRTATPDERFYIRSGYQTARLNFDREPRFYADLAFDGAVWYKKDSETNTDEGTFHVEAKYLDYAGSNHAFHNNITGYFVKKLVDWNMTMSSSGASYKNYPWPEFRLADLYLMYAEAMNEAYGPSEDALFYLDEVRQRAGLEGVADSWTKYSVNPGKYTTKEGLREIIQRERLIELAFEGSRFWDLRRWKLASQYLNTPITGWNVLGKDNETYYQTRTIYDQTFVAPRDYLWPIEENELLRNPNLVQNQGWQ